MRKIGAVLSAGQLEELRTKLEAFRDRFDHLATTTQLRELATEFNIFVGAFLQEFYPQIDKLDLQAVHRTEEKPFWKESGHESLTSLFAEIRADAESGKREDSHRSGKESLKDILSGMTETPAAEMTKDTGIER